MTNKRCQCAENWLPGRFLFELCSFSLEMHVSVELVTGALGWHYLFSTLHRSVMGVLESCPVRSDCLCLGSLVEKVRGNMLWCLLWWKLKIINNIFILWVSDASTSKQNTAQSHSFRTIISLGCMPQKLTELKSCSSLILNVKHGWPEVPWMLYEISLKFRKQLSGTTCSLFLVLFFQHKLAFTALIGCNSAAFFAFSVDTGQIRSRQSSQNNITLTNFEA